MPRKKSRNLTDLELLLMQVLWNKKKATVAGVVEALANSKSGPPPAYTTVLTMLRILERKGYLRHEKEGRAFVYKPVVAREAACRNEVANMLKRFFNNSPELLVLNILEQERIDMDELQRIRRMILESTPKEEKS